MQELLGHKDLRSTMIDTHIPQTGPAAVRSPLEQFGATDVIPTVPQVSMALQAGVTGDNPDHED